MALLGAASITGVPALGSENQQLGGRHFHSYLFRFSAVVDQREQGDSRSLAEVP